MHVVVLLSGLLQPKGCHKVRVKEDKTQTFHTQKQRGKAARGFPNEKYDSRKGRVQRTQRDSEAQGTMTATNQRYRERIYCQECLTVQG